MNMTIFDVEEIDMLMDALTAWQSKSFNDTMIGGMLMAAFSKDKEGVKEQWSDDLSRAKDDGRSREERAILVKAKLIQMKQQLLAQEAANFMTKE